MKKKGQEKEESEAVLLDRMQSLTHQLKGMAGVTHPV